jgi:hypothetical protein
MHVKPRVLAGLSLVLFAASLMTQPFSCSSPQVGIWGYEIIYTAPLGILIGEPRGFTNYFYFWIVIVAIWGRRREGKIAFSIVLMLTLATLAFPRAKACGFSGGFVSEELGWIALGGITWVIAMLLGAFAFYNTPIVNTAKEKKDAA